MLSGLYQLARPLFFALPPEDAHELTLRLRSSAGTRCGSDPLRTPTRA